MPLTHDNGDAVEAIGPYIWVQWGDGSVLLLASDVVRVREEDASAASRDIFTEDGKIYTTNASMKAIAMELVEALSWQPE
jgi:hypothetical protein